MIDPSRFRYQVEGAPTCATIYIGGEVRDPNHIHHLAIVADKLPCGIRVLRVDACAAASIDLRSLTQLRDVMAAWVKARRGTARLIISSWREDEVKPYGGRRLMSPAPHRFVASPRPPRRKEGEARIIDILNAAVHKFAGAARRPGTGTRAPLMSPHAALLRTWQHLRAD